MDYEYIDFLTKARSDYVIEQLSKTRPQEIIIIALLIIAIGIGIANHRAIKKLRDKP